MRTFFKVSVIIFLFLSDNTSAQNIYELRKLTDKDWINMSSEDRLSALNISNNHAQNQTFAGDFGRNYDLYPKWGYDFYEMEDRYENYAFRGFENYNIVEDRRNRWYYNMFGDRLTKMTSGGRIWYERLNDDGTFSSSGPSGYINSIFGVDGIWVAQESTDDWAISAIGAGALRAKLSPLTMSIPNLTGMKVDFQSANYTASIINSVLYSFGDHNLMLRGLQFRRKFGALVLGANYANMYAAQRSRDKGNDLKGTVNDFAPVPLIYAVRIVDDSPHDGDGPIVNDVKLRVNGVYRPDIQPMVIIDNLQRELVTAVSSKSEKDYLIRSSTYGGMSFDQSSLFERIPKYLDYMYMNDYKRGWNTKILTDNFDFELGHKFYKMPDTGGKPIQVNGNEYVVYLFDIASITDKVNRVEVELTVANDYRIQISQIFTKSKEGGHDFKGENKSYYSAEYWRTIAQADGNIKDGSNLRTIKVDFGYEVGNIIYGFDAHFNYLGFKVDGEFVTNTHYYMFSDGIPGTGYPQNPSTDITARDGYRSSQTDHAYYVVAQKDWKLFSFAGEYFKMGKFYRPDMKHFLPSELRGHVMNIRNDVTRMSLIEDNDDDDQYPDTQTQNKTMGYGYGTGVDPDGVFPGNDMDHDSYPDNEKNFNNIPDYDEPFLMFDVDPDEYVFGDDFNNNTIPDFREDDMKYDTPYDLDRKGHHFYVRFSPVKSLNLFAGSFRTRGVGLDIRTDDDYFKAIINYDVFTIGNIYAEYRYEKIQDNFQDSFVVVPTRANLKLPGLGMVERYNRDFYYDEIEYRNSRVNKFFLDSRIRAIPSITMENHVKYERNKQIEGTMYDNTFQPKDIVSILAMTNKFVYTKLWGSWTFSPGIKFRLYKKDRSESLNPLDHYLMRIPLVYLKYRVSPDTNVTLGIQGFKGFELQYRDYIQSHNDYKQINYMLQVENRTTYFGLDIWGGFGFKLEEIKFSEDYRKFEEYKSSSFFVRMWLGY
ncbi:MAG TPA: hypothetical protein ENH82_09755 [bacterium]|nr:hypothetical protein [bacterium]